jgi:hypothetical protein
MIVTRIRVLHQNGAPTSALLTELRLAATADHFIEHVSARAGPEGTDIGVFTTSHLGLAATAVAYDFVERVLVMSPHLRDWRIAAPDMRATS